MKNLVDARLRNVYLKPGEVFVSRTPTLVSTVLGSCVSVVIFSPEAGMGAMCHAQLPFARGNDDLRYVDKAVSYMYDRLSAISGRTKGFEVKLFGGAEGLVHRRGPELPTSIGGQNVAAAMKVIESLGLRVTASDTGGDRGRKIFFYSNSGEVLLRRLKKTIRHGSEES